MADGGGDEGEGATRAAFPVARPSGRWDRFCVNQNDQRTFHDRPMSREEITTRLRGKIMDKSPAFDRAMESKNGFLLKNQVCAGICSTGRVVISDPLSWKTDLLATEWEEAAFPEVANEHGLRKIVRVARSVRTFPVIPMVVPISDPSIARARMWALSYGHFEDGSVAYMMIALEADVAPVVRENHVFLRMWGFSEHIELSVGQVTFSMQALTDITALDYPVVLPRGGEYTAQEAVACGVRAVRLAPLGDPEYRAATHEDLQRMSADLGGHYVFRSLPEVGGVAPGPVAAASGAP